MEQKRPEQTISQRESKKVEIKHLPGVDVVVSPDCSPEDYDFLSSIFKKIQEENWGEFNIVDQLSEQINKLVDQDGNRRFHLKFKHSSNQENLDFIKDRGGKDYLDPSKRQVFEDLSSKETRYAHIGISNEMFLSGKIKNLVASSQFKSLVEKYGFVDLIFFPPLIAAVVNKYKQKYLVFKYIKNGISRPIFHASEKLVQELRKLFLTNGIAPNDLRSHQFIKTKDERGWHLYLTDIEAYREKKNPKEKESA